MLDSAREDRCEGRNTDEETMPKVIALIRHLRKKPKNARRMTHHDAAEELNPRGFKTSLGRKFTAQIVQNS